MNFFCIFVVLHSNSFLHAPPVTSSLIDESLSSLGNFDQCLSIDTFETRTSKFPIIKPKYCLVHLLTPSLPYELPFPAPSKSEDYFLNLAHRWAKGRNRLTMLAGICLPASCSSKKIQFLLEKCKWNVCKVKKFLIKFF